MTMTDRVRIAAEQEARMAPLIAEHEAAVAAQKRLINLAHDIRDAMERAGLEAASNALDSEEYARLDFERVERGIEGAVDKMMEHLIDAADEAEHKAQQAIDRMEEEFLDES